MAALWAVDPALAEQLEPLLDQEPYAIEPSKAGWPTLSLPTPDGRRLFLHSRHQPLDEARRLVESADLEGKTVLFVHGFALGYHVEMLFDRLGDEALIVVLEPDLHLLRTAFELRDFSRLLRTSRVMFLTQPDRAALMMRLGGHQALVSVGQGFLTHSPSQQLHGRFHAEVRRVIDEFLAFCRTSMNTLVLNGLRTCENIARNLGWYVATPGIGDLKNKHARQPAIIVSAGPSLRKNKHLLKDAQGRAVIVAVQTTLQPLLEMGIEPDYVTSLDYHDICTRFFEKLPPRLRTQLVAEPKASPAVFSLFPGPVRLLGSEFADGLLREMRPGKDRLRAGATVAHLAFYLAEYMGCDPIIFVGQDLGFSDGLCYTPGTSYEDVWRPELNRFCTVEMKQWEHIVRERPILRRIEDHQGRPMYTEERLFTYLQQFERDFAASPARIIDATEGGARKHGAEAMTLAEALGIAGSASRGVSDVIARNGPQCGPYRWDRLPECLAALRHRKDEAARIEQISGDTLPLLHEIHAHVQDQVRVNRVIAGIDALRAQMNQFNDCYELVTQLGQRAELDRFRNDCLLAACKASGVERQRRQIDRDIANVKSVISAAGQFQGLMDDVIARLAAVEARNRMEPAA